jgi:heme/copper-type cytochrome/quinol oxidase subunit 3
MIRPILTELVLFLTPFALYAVFLIVTRAKVFERANWPGNRVFVLTIIALLLVLGSFVMLAEFSGAPPGSTYEPARVENGKFIPGRTR